MICLSAVPSRFKPVEIDGGYFPEGPGFYVKMAFQYGPGVLALSLDACNELCVLLDRAFSAGEPYARPGYRRSADIV